MLYCGKCGVKLDISMNFCSKCGHKLSVNSSRLENDTHSEKIVFPMAIHVNAWLHLLLIFIFPMLVLIYLFNDNQEIKNLTGDFLFNSEEAISEVFSYILLFVGLIAIYVTYIKKRYLKYIDKVFYIIFFSDLVFSLFFINFNDSEEIMIVLVSFISASIPILWLFMSKKVKKFMTNA
jgi:hypothetical protein